LTAKGKYVIHTLEKRIECSQWGPLRRPLLSDVPSKKKKKKKKGEVLTVNQFLHQIIIWSAHSLTRERQYLQLEMTMVHFTASKKLGWPEAALVSPRGGGRPGPTTAFSGQGRSEDRRCESRMSQ